MANLIEQANSADAARLAPLVRAPDESEGASADRPLATDDEESFLDVRTLRDMYVDYLQSKTSEIEEQQDARRYYHGIHWSAEQLRVLRRRHQPPLTWNRVNRKINQIVGTVERMRSDPKAMPRHVRSEQGANIATQVIRYVLEANDFKGLDPWCLLQSCIDGVAGIQAVLTNDDQGQKDIALVWVIGDEFFYDPKSYRTDFKDSRYKGVSKWLEIGEAIEMFPDKADQLRGLMQAGDDLSTNPDRDYTWVMTSAKRVRIVEHWYKHKGKWRWSFYCSTVELAHGVSPFFDERGQSDEPFKMFSAGVDQDGDRYGFVRNLKGPQDSLNQSKSKSLHVANSRRIIAEKGAVDDVERARLEMARPDGFVEIHPGTQFKPDDRPQDLLAFGKMAEDAGNEIDQYAGVNIAALAGASVTNISGRAIDLLRQPGMAELGPFILAYRQWKLSLYRLIWNTAQRYWTNPKWLRLIDDETQKPVFMQLNTMSLDEFGRPVLVNALGALDVDITLEEGPDVASLMQDTYDMLKGYPPGTFPPQVLIEMSQLPRSEKNRIMAMLKPPPNPMQLAAAKLQMEAGAIKNAKTAADARYSDARAKKALAEAQSEGDQTQLDAAELQHRLWTEAAQVSQMPMPGQQPQPGAGPGMAPQPHPLMPPQAVPRPPMGI